MIIENCLALLSSPPNVRAHSKHNDNCAIRTSPKTVSTIHDKNSVAVLGVSSSCCTA